ncbi:MAG: AzlC family ABC transporter permease [Lachnospiraceae bacterium]
MKKSNVFFKGMRDGIPIGLGYFAVAFALGIAAKNAGISAFQGFVMSLLNNASAGEYAGIAAIKAGAPYLELALLMFITNARYLLMSCALSQRVSPNLPIWHRMLIGFDITDELFGLGIAYPAPLSPAYMYGAYLVAIPGWACGTAAGIIAGNLLPALVVTSLSAAIFGMFIAVIVPPARKNTTILILILVSFIVSWGFSVIPCFAGLTESLRIIILTVVIAVGAAILRPVPDEAEVKEDV